jgi:hypothetical protein
MSREHVTQKDIIRFAKDRVNFPFEKANKYRAQGARLHDKLAIIRNLLYHLFSQHNGSSSNKNSFRG